MKFNKIVRTALAAGTSLALGLGTVACSRDYTVAYVYSASASGGAVSAFAVDYQSGVLTQINGSPFASNFTNPSTIIAHPNGKVLYLIGGTHDAAVEPYQIGTDGKIYAQATVNITGTYPTAAAVDPTGTFLYVTFTYQTGFTPASPGNGGITVFPINADGTLKAPLTFGALNYIPTGNNPVGIAVSALTTAGQSFLYVVDQENSTYSPGAISTVMTFQRTLVNGVPTGAVTLTPGTTYNAALKTYQGVRAGVVPSAIAIEPTARFVYVTDKSSNQVIGYQIGSSVGVNLGNLTPLTSSPYTSGLLPVALTIDPRGKYLYTANYNANTVSGYAINTADGSLGGAAGAGNFTTATAPTCVTIEPALGIYLYTSNYLDGSISGAQLSPNTGQLNAIANTPFPASALPACAVSVPNGEHSASLVNP